MGLERDGKVPLEVATQGIRHRAGQDRIAIAFSHRIPQGVETWDGVFAGADDDVFG
jgi:hypothetical protein